MIYNPCMVGKPGYPYLFPLEACENLPQTHLVFFSSGFLDAPLNGCGSKFLATPKLPNMVLPSLKLTANDPENKRCQKETKLVFQALPSLKPT